MKRHPDDTITLTDREEEIYHLTIQLVVDEDMEVAEAAGHALAALPKPDPEFVLWLSQGALVRVGSTTYSVAELKAATP